MSQKAQGVYRQNDGESERALSVIDAEGVIRWSHVSPVSINPDANGILIALDSMAKGEKAVRGLSHVFSPLIEVNYGSTLEVTW